MSVKRRYIDAKHGQLHLRAAGQLASTASTAKTAIICLHMMPKSGRSFAALMPELARDRLVVAPDYPGYGESDPYSEIRQPSIEDYVSSIHEVVDEFQLSQIDLIGYHTGSMVAVAMAHRFPDLVRKIINISAPLFNKEEITQFHQYYAPVPLDEAGTRFSNMWQRIMHYRGPAMTLEMAATSMAENMRGGERYEDGHRAAFNFTEQYARQIEQITQSLWVMNLGDDLVEHSRRVLNHLKNGHLSEFPDWGHGCLEIWPTEIAQQMLKFLDS